MVSVKLAQSFKPLAYISIVKLVAYMWQPAHNQSVRIAWTALLGAQDALRGLQSEYVFNYPALNLHRAWSWALPRGVALSNAVQITQRYQRTAYPVWDAAVVRDRWLDTTISAPAEPEQYGLRRDFRSRHARKSDRRRHLCLARTIRQQEMLCDVLLLAKPFGLKGEDIEGRGTRIRIASGLWRTPLALAGGVSLFNLILRVWQELRHVFAVYARFQSVPVKRDQWGILLCLSPSLCGPSKARCVSARPLRIHLTGPVPRTH